MGELFKATCLIQPGRFRAICNFVAEASGGSGKVEVVAVAAQDAAAAPPREGEAAARDTGHAERDAAATVQGPLRGGYTQASAPTAAPVARRRAEPGGDVRARCLC